MGKSLFAAPYQRQCEATLKKSLFPVQRVAEIVTSRAAAISFFPPFFLF